MKLSHNKTYFYSLIFLFLAIAFGNLANAQQVGALTVDLITEKPISNKDNK